MTFNEARAVIENLKAARLKIELAELEGRLIDRAATLAAVRSLAQQDRDAILAWPARSARRGSFAACCTAAGKTTC